VKKNYHLYLGKAGHLAVMSEFLTRGWNVAIPEVDIGDDIFVVQDDNGTLRRVQVKTATSTVRQNNYSGQFNVPLTQLKNITNIPVHYVFIVRHSNQWNKPVVIRQDYLLDHLQNDRIGSEHEGNLNLYFSYSADKIECSGLDLSKYISDFTDFPLIEE
jgi:PD-(D/E)XK endonuclease